MAHSIAKANQTVKKSGKMQILKAMPAITTALIGTSLALTQPGKLSAKAATGLGFLVASKALSETYDTVSNTVDRKATDKNPKQKISTKLGAYATSVVALTLGAIAITKGSKALFNKALKPAGKFIKKEAQQLANEINNTKLAKFVDNTLNPFIEKHPKATKAFSILAPIGALIAGCSTQINLAKDISKDFKKEANKNFIKGKLIQDIARKEFDSINALEV